MVTFYKVASIGWIKIVGVMMDMMSKNARMMYVDLMDFIGAL